MHPFWQMEAKSVEFMQNLCRSVWLLIMVFPLRVLDHNGPDIEDATRLQRRALNLQSGAQLLEFDGDQSVIRLFSASRWALACRTDLIQVPINRLRANDQWFPSLSNQPLARMTRMPRSDLPILACLQQAIYFRSPVA